MRSARQSPATPSPREEGKSREDHFSLPPSSVEIRMPPTKPPKEDTTEDTGSAK